ncbi:MAG TPA: ABC transporter ATP-binding protein [Solirubrobacteraceae bacterium]|nr:ABC transporter ATP-binding protein [Solirubrobacteraceae bacterium]
MLDEADRQAIASQREAALDRPPAHPDGELAVDVRGLRRSYGAFEALAGIDLQIARGEVFALLGPNGAGKTTTIEILEGFRSRSAGEVRVLGVDPARAGAEWRARIGVVLQESVPEPELTVRECVSLYAGYYEHPAGVDETIALVGLQELAGRRCAHLSGGERRRLDVALALAGDPELLFLDEPTTGFDPAARRAAWWLVRDLRRLGKTIVLSTHYMEEAEQLADRIAVIAAGRILASGTPRTLGARELMQPQISFTLPAGVALSDLPGALRAVSPDGDGRMALRSDALMRTLAALSSWALEHGHELADLEVLRPSLEDVYLELTSPSEDGASPAERAGQPAVHSREEDS